MSDLLHEDILEFLRSNALGRDHAVPRHVLIIHLERLGHTMKDRTLRRIYAEMPEVGYTLKGPHPGIYFIRTAEEARETKELRQAQGKACLAHASRQEKERAFEGQGELF